VEFGGVEQVQPFFTERRTRGSVGAAHQEIRVRLGRDDKFVAALIANHLANLSSRPKRSVVERSAVFWTLSDNAPSSHPDPKAPS
jgi:hypothetical protein